MLILNNFLPCHHSKFPKSKNENHFRMYSTLCTNIRLWVAAAAFSRAALGSQINFQHPSIRTAFLFSAAGVDTFEPLLDGIIFSPRLSSSPD